MNSAFRSLSAAWPWTTVDLLNHLWQSTVVGVVVLAVLLIARGLSARTRRALGWMALLKFALPTGFLVSAFARLGATPERWVDPSALARPMMLPAFVTAVPAADAPARGSVGLVLLAVWLAGFVGLFVSWLVRSRLLRRQIFAEVQPVAIPVAQRIDAAAERAGLLEAPRCLAVDSERAPGVLGVIAPIVILPRGLEATLAQAELESVLIHEFVHVQRRDNFWSAGQAFFVCLFWFHPLVWWLNRRIGIETEQSCDERVLEITGDPDTYAGGIVKAVQHALGVAQPGLIGATTPPVITRIKNIFSHNPRRDRPMLRGAALTGGALLIALSGYAGSFAVPALAQTASPPVAEAAAAVTSVPTPVPVAAPAAATLSVDFPNEDIRQVIRNVADLFQLTVVIPVDLTGRATVKLKEATWRQIYRIILAPIGYTFVEEDKIVKIVPAEPLTGSAFVTPVVLGSLAAQGPVTPTRVSSFAGTLILSGNQLSFGAGTAPVAIGSLPARAAQARLIAQADELKVQAEKLQQEVDAYNAAQSGHPEAAADPEALAKAASLAAIDARRQAVDTAVAATADSARLAEITAQRAADAERQRAVAAEDRAKQQALIRVTTRDPRLKAPEDVSLAPAPKTGLDGAMLERALNRQKREAADEVRASGLRVFEPSQLDRQPVSVYQARPNYPFALRRSNTGGEATIDFIVNEQGDVVGAYALKFTHEEFAEAATAAVAKWKFKPGRHDGAAVATHAGADCFHAKRKPLGASAGLKDERSGVARSYCP